MPLLISRPRLCSSLYSLDHFVGLGWRAKDLKCLPPSRTAAPWKVEVFLSRFRGFIYLGLASSLWWSSCFCLLRMGLFAGVFHCAWLYCSSAKGFHPPNGTQSDRTGRKLSCNAQSRLVGFRSLGFPCSCFGRMFYVTFGCFHIPGML